MPPDFAVHPAGGMVLLVDDEEGVRNYCRRVLEAEGSRVVEAEDGKIALRLLQVEGSSIELVVTDILMPGISGRELAEVLSVFRPELPVLAITADGGATVDRRLPVLKKPFTPEEFLDAVARTRTRFRQIRSVAAEKRARARLMKETAMAAQLQSHHLLARFDLVTAAIALRRLDGDGRCR